MEPEKHELPREQYRTIGDLVKEAPSLLEERKERESYAMSDCHCPCPIPLNAVPYLGFCPL